MMQTTIANKMISQRNLLERIGERVPGYGGYHDNERRRDADKLLRLYLAEGLSKSRQNLMEIARNAANQKELQSLDLLDQLNRQLEKVADKIKFANYGYTGLFADIKVSSADLDRLYEHDHSLLTHIQEIGDGIESMQVDGLKSNIEELEKVLKRLDIAIDERDMVLRNITEVGK